MDDHFYALICPVEKEKVKSARNRRRRESKLLSKARTMRIDGMSLDLFGKLSVTNQFLHLRKFIHEGWRPVDFKPQVEVRKEN